MRKVIIWGIGREYEAMINQIQYEISKGNLEVSALIARPGDIIGNTLDGFKLIKKEDIWTYEFDYLIITSSRWYMDIKNEAVLLGVDENIIINGRVFKLPLFDFTRYVKLIENPLTIFSDDCWGGYIYHELCMKFYSPLINMYMEYESYIKFLENPAYYFEQQLVMLRDGNIRENIFPIGSLGGGKRNIELCFNHSLSFAEAEMLWNKRRERINYNNIFVKIGFDATEEKRDDYLRAFDKLSYNKICFYSGETHIPSVIYLKRFEWWCHQGPRLANIHYRDYCRDIYELFRCIDVFKMLNGEKDYVRDM